MVQIEEIPLTKLFVGKSNVRSEVGDITELTRSIEEEGVLQPLVVRRVGDKFEIVVGSRRFAASKAAGLKSVPAFVRDLNDDEALVISLTENIQRGDIEPEEEARAYKTLVAIYGSTRNVSKKVGVDHSRIVRTMQVLHLIPKLRKKVVRYAPKQDRTQEGVMPFEHATMLAEAFRTEEVKRLPEKEREIKQIEISKTIAPLRQIEARRVIDRFKMFPEKPIEIIKEEALASETGVALRVYFAPKLARVLSEAADDRGMSMEEVVPIAVEEWLKQVGYVVMA